MVNIIMVALYEPYRLTPPVDKLGVLANMIVLCETTPERTKTAEINVIARSVKLPEGEFDFDSILRLARYVEQASNIGT